MPCILPSCTPIPMCEVQGPVSLSDKCGHQHVLILDVGRSTETRKWLLSSQPSFSRDQRLRQSSCVSTLLRSVVHGSRREEGECVDGEA